MVRRTSWEVKKTKETYLEAICDIEERLGRPFFSFESRMRAVKRERFTRLKRREVLPVNQCPLGGVKLETGEKGVIAVLGQGET